MAFGRKRRYRRLAREVNERIDILDYGCRQLVSSTGPYDYDLAKRLIRFCTKFEIELSQFHDDPRVSDLVEHTLTELAGKRWALVVVLRRRYSDDEITALMRGAPTLESLQSTLTKATARNYAHMLEMLAIRKRTDWLRQSAILYGREPDSPTRGLAMGLICDITLAKTELEELLDDPAVGPSVKRALDDLTRARAELDEVLVQDLGMRAFDDAWTMLRELTRDLQLATKRLSNDLAAAESDDDLGFINDRVRSWIGEAKSIHLTARRLPPGNDLRTSSFAENVIDAVDSHRKVLEEIETRCWRMQEGIDQASWHEDPPF